MFEELRKSFQAVLSRAIFSCDVMRFHAISCDFAISHAISQNRMRRHAISCDITSIFDLIDPTATHRTPHTARARHSVSLPRPGSAGPHRASNCTQAKVSDKVNKLKL
jgi:hypothetical protein